MLDCSELVRIGLQVAENGCRAPGQKLRVARRRADFEVSCCEGFRPPDSRRLPLAADIETLDIAARQSVASVFATRHVRNKQLIPACRFFRSGSEGQPWGRSCCD